MTSPKRLIDEGTALDRALLRAAREDRPAPDFERRVIAAAVGVALPAPAANLARPSLVARLARPRFVAMAAVGIGAAALSFLGGGSSAPIAGAERPAESAAVVVANANATANANANANAASDEVASAPGAIVAVTTPDALPS
ncbi:MAG: hypothetical protein KF795_07365, partial [Labilithrix sp.]|nr:hypothetical protein [Labilithrix sp.]